MSAPFSVVVDCYAGYRGEETPRRFTLADRTITVTEVIDQWLAPDHRYFKVRGDDEGAYILRHDATTDTWEMTLFSRTPAAKARDEGRGEARGPDCSGPS